MGRIDGKPVPAEGLAVASFRHLTSARWTRSRTTTTSSSTPPAWPTAATGACGHGRCSHGARGVRAGHRRDAPSPLHHRGRPLAPQPQRRLGDRRHQQRSFEKFSRRRNEIDDALTRRGDRARCPPERGRAHRASHPTREEPHPRRRPGRRMAGAGSPPRLTVEALAGVVGHQHGEQALDTDVRLLAGPMASARGSVLPVPTRPPRSPATPSPATAGRSRCCAARNDCSS